MSRDLKDVSEQGTRLSEELGFQSGQTWVHDPQGWMQVGIARNQCCWNRMDVGRNSKGGGQRDKVEEAGDLGGHRRTLAFSLNGTRS